MKRTKRRAKLTIHYVHDAVIVHYAIRVEGHTYRQHRGYCPTPASFERLTNVLAGINQAKRQH